MRLIGQQRPGRPVVGRCDVELVHHLEFYNNQFNHLDFNFNNIHLDVEFVQHNRARRNIFLEFSTTRS